MNMAKSGNATRDLSTSDLVGVVVCALRNHGVKPTISEYGMYEMAYDMTNPNRWAMICQNEVGTLFKVTVESVTS